MRHLCASHYQLFVSVLVFVLLFETWSQVVQGSLELAENVLKFWTVLLLPPKWYRAMLVYTVLCTR